MLTIRPATKEDIISFRGKTYKESFKGLAAELNGKIVGIAGVLHTNPLQAFTSPESLDEELKKDKKGLILAIREYRKVLSSYNRPIYAKASENEKTAPAFLRYVGFKHHSGRIYKWQTQ